MRPPQRNSSGDSIATWDLVDDLDADSYHRVPADPSHLASTADFAAARYQLPKQINKSSASWEYGPGT
jgi:hypothetical protein